MPKDSQIFDLAIIGGGIAGAAIARDAALRGLRVVLFEKSEYGSGTSSKSSKLIHGGIRYLELAWNEAKRFRLIEAWKNFHFVFSSLKESVVLERIAPDLIKPLELVIPIYQDAGQNVWSIYFGTFLYALLAFLSGNRRHPRIFWTKRSILNVLPPLNPNHLAGAVAVWDHWTDDLRLVIETIRSAVRHGAEAHEHALVKHYRFDGLEKHYELTVEQGGKTQAYFAHKLINAGGPWVDQIRAQANEKTEDFIVPVAGSHIVLPKFIDHSVILRAEDKRVFFVIVIGNQARVGTTERTHKDLDHLEVLDEEVEYLLCALERYFPSIPFHSQQILSKDAGIRPLAKPKEGETPHTISREHEIRIGPTGVLHVLGVKLTDHRRAAKEVVDRLIPELKRLRPEIKTYSRTHLIPLAG